METDELDGLEVYQLFDRMEPLAAIEPVSMWPAGPGWWFLAGLYLCVLVLVLWLKHRRKARNRFRTLAVEALDQLPDDFSPLEVSAILKRCVLSQVPRSEVAALYGQSWSDYLNACLDGASPFDNFYDLLTVEFDREKLRRDTRYWLLNHRVQA